MCETNEYVPDGSCVWPPTEGVAPSDMDEIWDDSELLDHYKQVEQHVKAQVEAYRAGRAIAPSRKKRKNQGHKSKQKASNAAFKSNPDLSFPLLSLDGQPLPLEVPLANTSIVSSVHPWLVPTVEPPPQLLQLSTPPMSHCCSCSHHADHSGSLHPHFMPFPTQPQVALTANTGELDTAALLRAWYDAGYAMGQAHAEHILGLKNAKQSALRNDPSTVK